VIHERLPIGVAIGSVRADATWWLDAACRLDAAGYAGIWCWDHFMGRGDRSVPVLESWTMLTAAAGVTSRATVGPFVLNVMNRHPAVVARMAATLQAVSGGRLLLGIGIGGHPGEHAALGIPFPDPAERVARLEEGVAVLRALWSGDPVTRPSPFFPLVDAHAQPVPRPAPPIIVGGQTTRGARLAARIGDGWTAFSDTFERDLPAYLETLDTSSRQRKDQRLLVAFEGPGGTSPPDLAAWTEAPRETWERWRAAGADGAIVTIRTEAEVRGLLAAAERW
jgi:alkanesulfonate monooxygenase SsuD/methylene tetrahydromethanopterin reductase-like flavin-dependent oxidoreductase (luciferase family)